MTIAVDWDVKHQFKPNTMIKSLHVTISIGHGCFGLRSKSLKCASINVVELCLFVCLFELMDVLRPSQQQLSCRDVASILWDFHPPIIRMS